MRTTPRGTEILELPLNRRGRLKNANLDESLLLVFISSNVGTLGVEGRNFLTLCTRSMAWNLRTRPLRGRHKNDHCPSDAENPIRRCCFPACITRYTVNGCVELEVKSEGTPKTKKWICREIQRLDYFNERREGRRNERDGPISSSCTTWR